MPRRLTTYRMLDPTARRVEVGAQLEALEREHFSNVLAVETAERLDDKEQVARLNRNLKVIEARLDVLREHHEKLSGAAKSGGS